MCNELNARVYWLDQGITSIGLRPWTVYGVGRDFGMTSEPTKAIKSVAVGRPFRISYGGTQDLQYVADVAATFVRALYSTLPRSRRLQSAGRGRADRTIRECLLRGGTRSPVARQPRRPTASDRTPLDDSRLESTLGPIPRTPLRAGIAETLIASSPCATVGSLIYQTSSFRYDFGAVPAALASPVPRRHLSLGPSAPVTGKGPWASA